MVVQSDKIPAPGETILGGTFFMNPGGKGANQAVAAARLGGTVTFVANVGNDGREGDDLRLIGEVEYAVDMQHVQELRGLDEPVFDHLFVLLVGRQWQV